MLVLEVHYIETTEYPWVLKMYKNVRQACCTAQKMYKKTIQPEDTPLYTIPRISRYEGWNNIDFDFNKILQQLHYK